MVNIRLYSEARLTSKYAETVYSATDFLKIDKPQFFIKNGEFVAVVIRDESDGGLIVVPYDYSQSLSTVLRADIQIVATLLDQLLLDFNNQPLLVYFPVKSAKLEEQLPPEPLLNLQTHEILTEEIAQSVKLVGSRAFFVDSSGDLYTCSGPSGITQFALLHNTARVFSSTNGSPVNDSGVALLLYISGLRSEATQGMVRAIGEDIASAAKVNYGSITTARVRKVYSKFIRSQESKKTQTLSLKQLQEMLVAVSTEHELEIDIEKGRITRAVLFPGGELRLYVRSYGDYPTELAAKLRARGYSVTTSTSYLVGGGDVDD